MDLTGVWIGKTTGATTLSHHWIIVQEGLALDIYTRWENDNSFAHEGVFRGLMGADNLFKIKRIGDMAYGEILNEDHFKVLQWVYGLFKDGTQMPYFDVLFHRSHSHLQQFEVEFLVSLYENKGILKRFTDLPYA